MAWRKIILKGQVKSLSPLHIGSGSDDNSDMDILRDENGIPFIPATAFVGILNHSLRLRKADEKKYQDELKRFWGFSEKKEGHQSMFRCSDLLLSKDSSPEIIIRDGVRIDNKTGRAKDKGKYDYEILERGTKFNLKAEFSYKASDKAFVEKMVATICAMLKTGIQIGAKTNSGLGEIKLPEDQTKIYQFDFSDKKDVFYWLTERFYQKSPVFLTNLEEPFETINNPFCITATLQLKNSLIVRSYSDDPKMPDATHTKSLEDWILSGTSLKGAIRARAERIVNTFGKKNTTIIENLFGKVDDEKQDKNAKKGKIRVRETILPRFVAELQTRIRIDRFSGGTIEGALFDTMPLFGNLGDKAVRIEMNVRDCEEWEAGLLLLVLKDLWSGDLPVGGEKNVGRGVFQGISAIIEWNDEQMVIGKDLSRVPDDNREKLQGYVDALISENR
ncbi:MAG: hypothetical protein DRI57_11070 [Deltaproteobacteria bacterium]|nr:MAG: hypothetical protein DRI57_11070 [Deltaproteobacteria bacterium]